MNKLQKIFRMAMVAFAAIALAACSDKEPVGGGNNDEPAGETPTALYSEWLGSWVLVGDNNVSNSITIGTGVVNETVELSGLMRLPFSIEGEYSTERNDIIFYAQVVEEEYSFSGGQVGSIHLLGLDKEGRFYGLENGEYGIAIAGVLDGGERTMVRFGVNVPDYPKFAAMMLVAKIGDKYYDLDNAEEGSTNIPAFNIMAIINSTSSTSALSVSRSECKVFNLGNDITNLVR
ncbi:MAG: hypothetical protein J6C94_04425 [Alistipes sp.]|nr:hypothetical protein [Alistipes sp.]